MDHQSYSCPSPHKCPCLVVSFLSSDKPHNFSGPVFLPEKNGFNDNCLIRDGEKMKQFLQRAWQSARPSANSSYPPYFSLVCPLAIISHDFLYDIQTGLFCRISTQLLPPPSLPGNHISAPFSPPRRIPPLFNYENSYW